MNTDSKAQFLKTEMIPAFRTLRPEARGQWGSMDAQQMVEHMAGAFRNMYGLDQQKVISPPEHLPKMHAFLMSEKTFRPDTKNAGIPDEPMPPRFESMEESIQDLQAAMDAMFAWFAEGDSRTVINPIFGELDYKANVQLLHKHVLHHMRQFGLLAEQDA
jgi:hypothetical protein